MKYLYNQIDQNEINHYNRMDNNQRFYKRFTNETYNFL